MTVRHAFAVAALCLVATGCAARARPDGLQRVHVERLYFGRSIGDTAVVSDSAWAGFVRDILTPDFPDGATILDASGQWRAPNGALVRERTFVVELVHPVTQDVEGRVQHVIDAYKRRFAQQSVMRLVSDARVSF